MQTHTVLRVTYSMEQEAKVARRGGGVAKGRTLKDGGRGEGRGGVQWSCAAWGRWLLCVGRGVGGGGRGHLDYNSIPE